MIIQKEQEQQRLISQESRKIANKTQKGEQKKIAKIRTEIIEY